jgi:hypothetical protein
MIGTVLHEFDDLSTKVDGDGVYRWMGMVYIGGWE